MKLVSLKLKPKKKLRKNMDMDMPVTAGGEPKYPWGTEINLEDETIKKLGIDVEHTQAGDAVYLVAKGKITNLSMRDNMEGKKNSLSVQITDMSWGKP